MCKICTNGFGQLLNIVIWTYQLCKTAFRTGFRRQPQIARDTTGYLGFSNYRDGSYRSRLRARKNFKTTVSEMAEIFAGQSNDPDDTPDPDEGQ
jgi:hypothetical protein